MVIDCFYIDLPVIGSRLVFRLSETLLENGLSQTQVVQCLGHKTGSQQFPDANSNSHSVAFGKSPEQPPSVSLFADSVTDVAGAACSVCTAL